jgi:SAM-dependent methyltransferase
VNQASKEIIGLYERHAQAWDAGRPRVLMEKAWLERYCELLAYGGRVLDLGCGAADPLARYFINRGFDLTGVDSSPSMISMCRERFPAQDWYVADMRGLALGKVFDGILAWDSFFHLTPDDQRSMFSIFRKHALPGAVLMFTSGPSRGEAIGSLQGEPLYHGSLDAEEYRCLLFDNGFDVLSHAVEDPNCGRHTIWLAQRRR